MKQELDTLSQKSFIYQVNYEKKPKSIGRLRTVSVTIDLIIKAL
jgi:hypothetical protein